MKTIIYLASFVLFTALLWFIGAAIYFIYQWRKDCKRIKRGNERFYKLKYDYIQDEITKRAVTPENYQYLWNQLEQLANLQYKNKEKTVVLSNRFWVKFYCERVKDVKRFECKN
ncbi:MAG TPA: hypothetical protein VMV77_09100 [Bacteroidales bacterium]|nr:hypothetical protein [Bacteroidales bacterium]